MTETYIPSARDTIIAYHGRSPAGGWRTRCVTCMEIESLAHASPVYGDLYVPDGPDGRVPEGEECEMCGSSLLAISRCAQDEHDAQQARFARLPVTHLVEYGIPGAVRCRIY